MFKVLSILALTIASTSAFASQNYFSCSLPITGGYALEGQEFGIVIKSDENSVAIINGSSDPIYPLDEIATTNVRLQTGGPNGWPQSVSADYVSNVSGRTEQLTAVFKVGKSGRPAVTYTSSEENKSYELQCF